MPSRSNATSTISPEKREEHARDIDQVIKEILRGAYGEDEDTAMRLFDRHAPKPVTPDIYAKRLADRRISIRSGISDELESE